MKRRAHLSGLEAATVSRCCWWCSSFINKGHKCCRFLQIVLLLAATYQQFADGHPQGGTWKNFVMMHSDGNWRTVFSNIWHYFVCERSEYQFTSETSKGGVFCLLHTQLDLMGTQL